MCGKVGECAAVQQDQIGVRVVGRYQAEAGGLKYGVGRLDGLLGCREVRADQGIDVLDLGTVHIRDYTHSLSRRG